ncbi:pentatricopeptide repeat-containing protein [Iris pallida]|uniref:Pentatricopeptide repeat-containing protein n=1 Tax=Iris pallida TaxID=29817 RepID=A0AAX6HKX4_IRIPA|nr:pentatricopeptide repeat-containing protein [Iris pallida]
MGLLCRYGELGNLLMLLNEMSNKTIFWINYTAVSLLSICSNSNGLELGCSLHGLTIKRNVESSDVFAHNLLMDMYAKCGNLEGCLRVFEESYIMDNSDIRAGTSWLCP